MDKRMPFLFLCVMAAGICHAGAFWVTEDAVTGVSGGGSLAIHIDASGIPWIAAEGDLPGSGFYKGIIFSGRSSGVWTTEYLDPDAHFECGSVHMYADEEGLPVVIYIQSRGTGEYPVERLKCARRTGTGWDISTIDEFGYYRVSDMEMMLDGSGNPHLTFFHYDGMTTFAHVFHDGSGWHTESTFFTMAARVLDHAVAVSDSGMVQLIYLDADGNVGWVRWDGETPKTETIGTFSGDWSGDLSAAVDLYGNPHIVYRQSMTPDGESILVHGWLDKGIWNSRIVNGVHELGPVAGCRLSIDPSGTLALVFYQRSTGYTQWLLFEEDEWFLQRVDTGSYHPAATYGLTGTPHIVYRNGDRICHARRDEAVWYALQMPDLVMNAGDTLVFDRHCGNPAAEAIEVAEYMVLDIQGRYWFWPSWSQPAAGVNWTLESGCHRTRVFEFAWPGGTGAAAGIRFWGGLIERESGTLLVLDVLEWSYDS